MKQQILARVAALALLAGSTTLYADSVKLSDLPNSVQKTVTSQAGSGKVGNIEKTTENGRTVYHVEVKREGQNKHIYVSESGTVLRSSTGPLVSADTHVETGKDKKGITSKTDGKILGIIPAPARDNKDAEVRVKAGDNEFKAEADLDGEQKQVRTEADKEADRLKVRQEAGVSVDRDRNLTSKTDGKILGLPIPGRDPDAGKNANVRVDADNDASARVDVDVDTDSDQDITSKNDGRILGIPIPDGRRNTASVQADADLDKGASASVDVDTDNDIIRKNDGKILGIEKPDGSVRADVDVDTDNDIVRKNDGRILGVPKPDGSARADVDIDTDDRSARVDADVDTNDDKVFQKGDGKILGIPVNRDNDRSARADVDIDTDDKSARVDADVDTDGDKVFQKGDGKILGVPVNRDNSARADIDLDTDADKGASARVDVDVDRDRDLTSKNDGRILGVPKPEANTRVEADTHVDLERGTAEVEVKKKRSIFGKGDGKILGIFPAPSARKNQNVGSSPSVESRKDRVQGEVKNQPQNRVTTDADGGLDTDDGDGRILGVPKRGFENLTINQVPAPVRRAIEREAGTGKIVEIELENEDGQSVYEVDIERDGANRELKITPDGTVLQDND